MAVPEWRQQFASLSPQSLSLRLPIMPKNAHNPRRFFYIFLFLVTCLLTVVFSLTWVNAEEESKPKPQDWEIKGIVAALADPYAGVRQEAANKLGEYQLDNPKKQIPNYESVVNQLVNQLSPPDKEEKEEKSLSRRVAAVVLAEMQAKDFAPNVAALLKDSDSGVRSSAADALGNMQAKDIAPNVAALLKDSDSDVRSSAADALGKMQAKNIAPNVAALLKDSDSGVRRTAAYALGKMQAKDFAPNVAALLKDSDTYVRRTAADALANMQAKDFAPNVAALLKDSDTYVRRTAADALANMQAKDFAPNVAALLKDSDSGVRSSAADALANMQAKDFAPNVAALLKDSDSGVRSSAADALGKMQAKDIAPNVAALLKDSDTYVRSSAAVALANMQAKDFAPNVAALLKDSDSGVRRTAADALANMQAKDFAPNVAALLKDSDSGVRRTAADALANMQAKDFAPNVAALLKDSDSGVRRTAADALANMQAKDFAPNVAALLKDSDSGVRSSAADALANMQAKDFAPNVAALLKDSDSGVRRTAADALGKMQAKDFAPNVAALLKDSDSGVRRTAADALGKMQAKDFAPDVAALLSRSLQPSCFNESMSRSTGSNDCNAAVITLIKLGKLNLPKDLIILAQVLNGASRYPFEDKQFRFLAHFIGGGEPDVETLMQWLGKPKTTPKDLNADKGKKIMELFERTWKITDSLPDLRQELAKQIGEVAKHVHHWQAQDITLLERHYKNLKKDGHHDADTVRNVIDNLEFWKWFFLARNIILIHLAIWLTLILAYPKFTQVLAPLFWNPWLRRIFGFGYIGLLLTLVPWLRQRLLQPFKPLLLADAGLDNFVEHAYFAESYVRVPRGISQAWEKRQGNSTDNITPEIQPVTQAIPTLQGQIVLEGESGLGKSMFLRHLVNNSQRIFVYLPAQKCDKGVIEAIYTKLRDQVEDAKFLKNLVYNGALNICIDGLNEVTADTRAKISLFAESYLRGNIIMTTQPLDWIPPSTAKKYELQPLQREQIKQFLLSRYSETTEYTQACSNYIAQAFNEQQSPEDLAAAKRILSNPMDLTLVALMLSQGQQPNLFRLQEQQYQLMAAEFLREWQHEFPLTRFSQAVYQMRLNDETTIPAEEFKPELTSLEDEKYKMVISRQWENDQGEAQKSWYFRHDKIMEFFLVQNFLGGDQAVAERVNQHIDDPRFRGVYLLLANLLPLDAALGLRERIIQYAANSKDHTLHDKFVQLLQLRLPSGWAEDATFTPLLEQYEQNKQKTQYLDLVAQFLEKVDAKVKREKEHLIIESIDSSLSIYAPFPVLITVGTPTEQHIKHLVKLSQELPTERTEKACLLIYTLPPDTIARMEIAKVLLRDHFLLIPIPVTSVEKALPDKHDCIGLLEEYIDRYFQRADFFDDKNAISDTLSFFGRTELLQRLGKELLRYQGVGLFGLRKSGKTSVLLQLGFMLREHPIVHIDLQVDSGSRYGATLFNKIIQNLSAIESEVLLPKFEPFPSDKPAAELTSQFIQRVQEIASLIEKSHKYKLPILCFLDEVERIIPTPEDSREKAEEFNAFFGALRVLCQEKQQMSLLIADVHPDCNRINSWTQPGVATNPVFSFFKEIFLPPFSADETQEMLVNLGKLMGLEFDAATPQKIHEQSGGHPFVSRQIARFLTEKIKKNNPKPVQNSNLLIEWAMVEPYLEKILTQNSELKNYLERSVWEDLTKRDFQVAISILRVIACNEQFYDKMPQSALLNQLKNRFTTNQCADACNWLTSVGLLYQEEVEHQDSYYIRIALLSRWIQLQMTEQEIEQCRIFMENVPLIATVSPLQTPPTSSDAVN